MSEGNAEVVWHLAYLDSPQRSMYFLCFAVSNFSVTQTIVMPLCHALIALFVHVPVQILWAFIGAYEATTGVIPVRGHISQPPVFNENISSQTC